MFTGLIEAVCTVRTAVKGSDSMQLTVDLAEMADTANIGDSISINGVCLTVTGLDGRIGCFDVSGETLSRSTMAKFKPSMEVNVERAMQAGGRFGGHFVQGHIDGTANLRSAVNKGDFWELTFNLEKTLLDQMVLKGSVAIDGISLTIAKVDQSGFSVAIIPQTWEKTNLSRLKTGDAVNIETDIIVKTVKKQLEVMTGKQTGLSIEKLKELGF